MNIETRNSDGSSASVSESNPFPIHVTGATVFGQIKPTNYLYVGKNGNDTSGDGSAGNPYLTIGAAIAAASSGTTISIWPGTYIENITFKAGVNLTCPVEYGVYIIGNHTASLTAAGTIICENIILQNPATAASGTTLAFGGTYAQNFQLLNSFVNSASTSGAGDAVSWTNTNASSKIQLIDGNISVAHSNSTARAFYSSATAKGGVIANRATLQVDNLDNTCLVLDGAISFVHTSDVVNGRIMIAVGSSAYYLGSNVALNSATYSVFDTNSSGISILANAIITTTASPAITGAGGFTFVGIEYGSSGIGGEATLNAGAGALPLTMAPIRLRSSALLPAASVSGGLLEGTFEFDGTNPYFTASLERHSIYLAAQVTHVLYVDNSRTDTYTQDGSIVRPYKTFQAAHDYAAALCSATNVYRIEIVQGVTYTGTLNITADYIIISGSGASKDVGFTGTMNISSTHCLIQGVHLKGATINGTYAAGFLLEFKDCRDTGSTWTFSSAAPASNEWIQVTGGATLLMGTTINVTNVTGVLGCNGGIYQGVTFNTTDSVSIITNAEAESCIINAEDGSITTLMAGAAMNCLLNLKSGALVYADQTFMDTAMFDDQGGTLVYLASPMYDGFNRDDSASTLGNMDTAQTWVDLAGTPKIVTRRAGATVAYTGYIDSGYVNAAISAKIISRTAEIGLIFRVTDANNYYLCYRLANTIVTQVVVAGVATTLNTTTLTFVSGEILKVVLDGSTIKVFRLNTSSGTDTLVTTITDSTYTTQTKHGIYISGTADYLDDFTIRKIR